MWSRARSWLSRAWIPLVFLAAAAPAFWHVVDFEQDSDPEYPAVVRPTFSAFPPAAYRLAEPGDTIDRSSLYLASIALVLSTCGLVSAHLTKSPTRPWIAALLVAISLYWYNATPGPSPDGWHGLGFRAVANPAAPPALRLALLAGLSLPVAAAIAMWPLRRRWIELSFPVRSLLIASGLLVILRLTGQPDLEPAGYWTRWAGLWSLFALVLALALSLPRLTWQPRRKLVAHALAIVPVLLLITAGLRLVDFHRPIPRLLEAVPGKIYISAMPTYRGLELAQKRHGFKTIINLFAEDTPLRSPLWPQEVAFVRDHHINYLRSPADPDAADEFLDRTLATVQDPNAWPVLVHCHGCMDRTPAWLGIYRYVVEGWSLDDIFRAIERHRGYRPKASVTLLYNHVLPRLAPERYAQDPIAAQLRRNAQNAQSPYDREPAQRLAHPGNGERKPPALR